jgi:hypothetical protein
VSGVRLDPGACDDILAAIADLEQDINYVDDDIQGKGGPDPPNPQTLAREKRLLERQLAQLKREAALHGCRALDA